MSQSAKRETEPSEWVSRWERELAWDATFGNRSGLPWPYRTTRLKHVLGEPTPWTSYLAGALRRREERNGSDTGAAVALAAVAGLAALVSLVAAFGGAL